MAVATPSDTWNSNASFSCLSITVNLLQFYTHRIFLDVRKVETLNFEVGLYCVLTISNFDAAIYVAFPELNWRTAVSIQTLYIAKFQSRIRFTAKEEISQVDSLSEIQLKDIIKWNHKVYSLYRMWVGIYGFEGRWLVSGDLKFRYREAPSMTSGSFRSSTVGFSIFLK